jgi:methionyl-tRNA formyltransferase
MINKPKIIFAGTPQFAVPTLEKIYQDSFEIVCVLTQPDRKAGRGMKIMPSNVKKAAKKLDLLIMQPDSLKDSNIFNTIKGFKADILVVVAYGLIIPENILSLFKKGCFNLHASLLPRWRGAAPIHRAIEIGDNKIGVTIMKVVNELDAGPMIKKKSIDLSPKSNSGELMEYFSIVGAELMLEVLNDLAKSKEIIFTMQDESKVTYAKKIDKKEALINLNDKPHILVRKIKAFNPYPGIKCIFRGKILKLWDASLVNNLPQINLLKVGTLKVIDKKLILMLQKGAIQLIEVQPEGTKKIKSHEFILRYKIIDEEVIN